MNQEIKKLWVEALRSGEYAQTGGELRVANKFCCLGVLCDIYKKEKNDGEWDEGTFVIGEERECSILPSVVWRWAELSDFNPNIFGQSQDGEQLNLAVLNDDNVPFDLIAAIIETEL